MTEFIPPGTRFLALPDPFPMKRGDALHGARMAYETWGRLNPAGDNAVLILTGLSPDAHAASHADNPEPGWWEAMLGPGKPIDTDRWFVICANSLGSCKGSTGPANRHFLTWASITVASPIHGCARSRSSSRRRSCSSTRCPGRRGGWRSRRCATPWRRAFVPCAGRG